MQIGITIQRLLPGPIERVWAYLTESDLRKTWLAAGEMSLEVGAPFEWTWRNNELTTPSGARPDDFGDEHRMTSTIVELDPPHTLTFVWHDDGNVTFDLKPVGDQVLLTVTHRRLGDHDMQLMVGPGWHSHLDLLATRLTGETPEPFWESWRRLKLEYAERLPG
jgi:uncharacterized protein YndB with AHSA1/START domain